MVSLKTLVVNLLLLLTFTAEAFQSRWRIRQRSVVVGKKDTVLSHYVKCGLSTSTSINAIGGGAGDDVNIQLNDNKKSSLSTNDKSSQQGRAILLLVAFLYGTLNGTLRGV